MNFLGKSNSYKFGRDQEGKVYVNTVIGKQYINDLQTLGFQEKSLDVEKDIMSIFNQIDQSN